MIRQALLLAAAAALLSGCVSAETRALRKTEPYHAGYDDGCASATAVGTSYKGTPIRNDEAYAAVKAYRLGWNTGYSACRRTEGQGTSDNGSLFPKGPGH